MSVVVLQPKQIADVVNNATSRIDGMQDVSLAADLSNVVDFGTALSNASAYQNFLEELPVQIATMIFKDKTYSSKAPDIFRSNFEWGQITQVTRSELPEADDNQSWMLQDGATYSDDMYIKDHVITKIFKDNDAWEIRKSVKKEQLKNAFRNATELGSFMSMIWTQVQNSITVKLDSLIMYTITSAAAEVLNANDPNTSINLLAEYKKINTTSQLTAETCIFDKAFLQYATGIIKEYQKIITNISVLFNQGKAQTFTEMRDQHLVLLSKFENNCSTYLESDTFHNEFVALPHHETVAFWNGIGKNTFTDKSTINVKTPLNNTIKKTGVLGVLFDDAACAVTKDNPSIETHYVKSGQFYNYWFKHLNQYCVNLDENFIVFYVAD